MKGGIMYGGFLLFIYSMGLGIPMLLIAYFINVSGKKLSIVSRYDVMIKRGAGALLILVGLYLRYKLKYTRCQENVNFRQDEQD